MKLPMRVAGLCWSLTFLVTAVPGFYQQTRPTDFATISSESFSGMAILETLSLSFVGSLAAGMFGYIIGDILAKPNGGAKKTARAKAAADLSEKIQASAESKASVEPEPKPAKVEDALEAKDEPVIADGEA